MFALYRETTRGAKQGGGGGWVHVATPAEFWMGGGG